MPGGEKFDEVFSKGDVMRRLDIIEQTLRDIQVGRSLQAATIGTGGVRIRGGVLRVQDEAGDDMFRAGGSPGEVFIRPDLLAPLARAIFAAGVHIAKVPTQFALGDTGFDFVSQGGPTIEDVQVDAGVMIMWIDALVQTGTFDLGESNGQMCPEISGATSKPANATDLGFSEHSISRGTNIFQTDVRGRHTTTFIATDLNPGLHNIEVMYRGFVSGGGNPVLISSRSIAVLAF